jgi:hypothetical protein
VVSVRPLTTGGGAAAELTVRTERRSLCLLVDERTEVSIRYANLTSGQSSGFLRPGVGLRAEWEQLRDPRSGGFQGRLARRIVIEAAELRGSVVALGDTTMTVRAVPLPAERGWAEVLPLIRAAGRRSSQAGRSDTPPQPAPPTRMTWRLVDGSRVTLNEKEADRQALADLWKGGRGLDFDAVVVAGAGQLVAEFHAREAPRQTNPGRR